MNDGRAVACDGIRPAAATRTSASSASPTRRHAHQLARLGGRQVARVEVAFRKDTASEPHLCSLSHPAGRLGDRPDLAGEADLAENGRLLTAPGGSARSRRPPRRPPGRRPARRSTCPPATLTNTSSPTRLRPARFSSTATQQRQAVLIDADRHPPRRCRTRLPLTSACTSTRIGRDPSMQHTTAEPGDAAGRSARNSCDGFGTGRRPVAGHLEHAELATPRRTGSSPRG